MNIKSRIKIFADGASISDILSRYRKGGADGFTTNPTLMAKAGIKDYEKFAREILAEIQDLPISFEVFSDDFPTMEEQALKIASWGKNVNVKIPICNSKGVPALSLIEKLLKKGLKLNVTAVMPENQVLGLREIFRKEDDVIVSIFAGRIADTGIDPVPLMKKAVAVYKDFPKIKVLWASPREVLNIYQAAEAGCQIITATDSLIDKLELYNKNLNDYSLETVRMFYDDAVKAGFSI